MNERIQELQTEQEPVACGELCKEKTSDNVDEWQYIEGWNDAIDIAEQHFNTQTPQLQAEAVAVVGPLLIEQIPGTILREGDKLYAAPVQPVKQEPVAWRYNSNGDWIYKDRKVWDDAEPLYTAPVDAKAIRAEREWVDLTDDEIAQAVGSPLDEVYMADFRAVIAAFKEKNK